MSDAAAAGDKAPAPAKSNKLLLLIVLVFNVLIAGGLAYVVLSGQQAPAPAKGKVAQGHGDEEAAAEEHHEEEEEEEAHTPKGTFGPLIPVGSFVANLGAPSNKSYLKVSLHVEAANEEAKVKVEAAIVPMRSEALQFLSGITPEQAIGIDKIAALQNELHKRFTAMVGKKTIKRVYFSEFVVQ
jgi:flagellar protein FliL